ncbi:MAG: translation elongation factor Ts [Chitinispirillaceae bacterium]|nr:translation elongation factor Ts [Chitinispirillaceae bacterium]
MEISAAQVKDLREKTGIGMMLCKQALIESKGDMKLAIENLRKQGQMTAAKRAGKTAKEGIVSIVADATSTIVYEVNSETDFVARNGDFASFVENLGKLLLVKKPASLEEAKALVMPGSGVTVDARVTELIGKIGENLSFRRYRKVECDPAAERIATYVHGKGKIGVAVKLSASPAAVLSGEAVALLGKDLAMQVAAAVPLAADRQSIPAAIIDKEKEIYLTQVKASGKPEKIWDKIVEGKLAKFYKEAVLVEQEYIRDQNQTVTDRIKAAEKETGAQIKALSFVRLELGAEE